ncbi:hypothetical protein [Spirulina sp. 06S082]|uniref:hypothetical protein n=1 Tax=Spirulina sp. 06S082 TaxID=3110248 RepID=UPI002B21804C|nr:hypothetical protein [Spirulina sp. 06S082]MEA5469091.1 hypothetical protein [Spirulina sp. 06S082]
MKLKLRFLAVIFLLTVLNSVSCSIIFYVTFDRLLYPYYDISDPRINTIVSGQTLLGFIVFTAVGIIISILTSSVSLFFFLREYRANQFLKRISFGFAIISVVALLFLSFRFIELLYINISLGGDCIFEQHCQSIERSLMFV